jgi:hypothetical protein
MLHKNTLKNEDKNPFKKIPDVIFIHSIFLFFPAKDLVAQKHVSKRHKFFAESVLKKTENNIFYAINHKSIIEIGKSIQKGPFVTYHPKYVN